MFLSTAPPTPQIYTLSLHDALPISPSLRASRRRPVSCGPIWPVAMPSRSPGCSRRTSTGIATGQIGRSEEHTSELQSHHDLVCRLLLEKKKAKNKSHAAPATNQRTT